MTHEERATAAGAIADVAEAYRTAALEIRAIVDGEPDLVANLANTVSILAERRGFFWVGVYRLEGAELVLGPFHGTPACTRIALGRGVCGVAAQRGEPLLVPDVHAFPGHIACDGRSRSEVVVPIRDGQGRVRGVIDVDSDRASAFGPPDVEGLGEIARILGGLWQSPPRASEEPYRQIAEHSTDMITRHALDGTYLYASPACRALIGYEPEELVGKQGYDLVHEEDVPQVRVIHERILSGGDPVTLVCRVRSKTGAYRWIEFTAQAVREPAGGDIVEIIAVSRDVGQRKRAEDESRRLLHELAHAARVASMGEIGSGLAHELNQPLAAISNYLEVGLRSLEPGANQPERARQALEAGLQETRRAGEIIQWIRGFVRRGESSRAAVETGELVREVVSLAAWEVERSRVEVELDLDRPAARLEVERIQVQQVLLNLLRNAIDAIEEAAPAVRHVGIRTRTRDGRAEFTVWDSGAGLGEEAKKRLFEPFFTTKPHGLGLGLAISKSLVEAHGGRLALGDGPGSGAAFVFTLPLAHEAPKI